MKQNKTILFSILLLLLAVVLAAAFWYGGNAPGQQGWEIQSESQDTIQTTQTNHTTHTNQQTAENMAAAEDSASTLPENKPESRATDNSEAESTQSDRIDQTIEAIPNQSTADTRPTVTISISCATILNHLDRLTPEKENLVPADGIILPTTTVTLQDGESVFDLLQRTCRENKIHMEFADTPIYHSAYIEGIANVYEFDCGDSSGWMYRVNGLFPNYGCSQYKLQPNDVICWVYTCDMGADVGNHTTAN